ncbi:hypothetical protein PROPEN_01427 [Proteus penneri ATCC 35198]|nr:hypothetical protein PROPEN_01427 [Proteus penneri ATCC 35198]
MLLRLLIGALMEGGDLQKNPWFVGFIMTPAIYGGIDFSFYWYFIHFIVIAIGLLGVWNLAYKLTQNTNLAWFAMLSLNLSGVINFDIIPYNDNYILVGCWAWAFYFFLCAINDNQKYWIGFAITMGIATMGKYSSLAFMGSVFLSSLFVPKVRASYCSPYFYIALVIWFAFVIPNFIWLWQTDFAAFKWVDSQIENRFNLRTTRAVLTVFYPIILMWVILRLYGGRVSWSASKDSQLLNFVLLFPLVIIFLSGLVFMKVDVSRNGYNPLCQLQLRFLWVQSVSCLSVHCVVYCTV